MKGTNSRTSAQRSAEAGRGPFAGRDRALLLSLQKQAFRYFVENQLDHGLILDRQHNHGRRNFHGLCSIAATGMGLIALALASHKDHRLLTEKDARRRIRKALETCLSLKQVEGMMPHFIDADTLEPVGTDPVSTIDSSWLLAGALWAAEFLNDDVLRHLAMRLFERVDWQRWAQQCGTAVSPLIAHGIGTDGKLLPYCWDRFNGETAFMYMLAMGAARRKRLPVTSWTALKPFYGSVEDIRYISADLGLFVFQYTLEVADGKLLPRSNGVSLDLEDYKGVLANYFACKSNADKFKTFQYFWALSAGDGPPEKEGGSDVYRTYSPLQMDGTAHLMASLASVGLYPFLVLENVRAAQSGIVPGIRGRYGYSNVNMDRNWVSRDVVGIDVGAALFAIENLLFDGRVSKTFHRLTPVKRAMKRLSYA